MSGSRITVGLDEHDKANGRGIHLLQPPGGESQLGDLHTPDLEIQKISNHNKIIQPPGGASSDIFGSEGSISCSSSDTGSENGEAEPVKKPYRMKSSFVLGEAPPHPPPKTVKKKSIPAVNPITGKVIEVVQAGDSVVTKEVAKEPPKPAKINRVPPGGHSTKLW